MIEINTCEDKSAMQDIKEVLKNIENIYGSTTSLSILKDFERVLDELDLYVYENWIDGELVAGPKDSRYWVTCSFMWPLKKMPNPQGGKRLLDYGCKVLYKREELSKVRKIKTPDDIRPGTKKGKIDREPIWVVEVHMPKKLMFDINKGYRDLKTNQVDKDIPKVDMPMTQQQQGTTEPVEGQI